MVENQTRTLLCIGLEMLYTIINIFGKSVIYASDDQFDKITP